VNPPSFPPPTPRLMARCQLVNLPNAPALNEFPDDALGVLSLLSVEEDGSSGLHVATVVATMETDGEARWFVTEINLHDFRDLIPAAALVNCPDPTELLVDEDQAASRRRRRRRRGRHVEVTLPDGAELASRLLGRSRPTRETVQYLELHIDWVASDFAMDYVEALQRVRKRRCDKATRELYVCVLSELHARCNGAAR